MDIYLQTQQSSSLCSLSNCSFWFPLAGTGIPEERAAGARWQVCVGGEPVHHRGQLQLHWCRGLSHRGQRTGESFGLCGFSRKPEGVHVRLSRPDSVAVACRHRRWKLASHFLSMQLFLQARDLSRKATSRRSVSASCCSATDTLLCGLLVAMCEGQECKQEHRL